MTCDRYDKKSLLTFSYLLKIRKNKKHVGTTEDSIFFSGTSQADGDLGVTEWTDLIFDFLSSIDSYFLNQHILFPLLCITSTIRPKTMQRRVAQNKWTKQIEFYVTFYVNRKHWSEAVVEARLLFATQALHRCIRV